MFKTNGRVGKSTIDNSDKASIKGKEFVCSACGEKKYVVNVEFGELVLCDCGNPMEESYE